MLPSLANKHVCVVCWVAQVCPILWTTWTVVHQGDSLGKNTGIGCHALPQGIFSIQGSNPGLPHCGRILYHLSHHGSPSTGVGSLSLLQGKLLPLQILYQLTMLVILKPVSRQTSVTQWEQRVCQETCLMLGKQSEKTPHFIPCWFVPLFLQMHAPLCSTCLESGLSAHLGSYNSFHSCIHHQFSPLQFIITMKQRFSPLS